MSALPFHDALDNARTLALIDEIARDLWRAFAAGTISEREAEDVSTKIENARKGFRPQPTARPLAVPRVVASLFGPRQRRCVSPDRVASRQRRRRLAYSGPMPPALAAGFTTGQLATLRIIADEAGTDRCCALTLNEIAARAGVGATTARKAIRLAAGDGLVLITERPQRGKPNLSNLVKIVSSEWRAWIARREGGGGGCKNADPTDRSKYFKPRRTQPKGLAAPQARPIPVNSVKKPVAAAPKAPDSRNFEIPRAQGGENMRI